MGERIDGIKERVEKGIETSGDVRYLIARLQSAEQAAVLAGASENREKAKAILKIHFDQYQD